MLDEIEPPFPKSVRFRLSPDVMIAVGTNSKVSGEAMVGERIALVARHDPSDEMDAYPRLRGDAMKGDATLFARGDGVEAAGHVVQPILDILMPLHEYERSTWSPREADRLIEGG